MLAREPAAERKFAELYVRSETAIGAEGATGLKLGGGRARTGAATAAMSALPRP